MTVGKADLNGLVSGPRSSFRTTRDSRAENEFAYSSPLFYTYLMRNWVPVALFIVISLLQTSSGAEDQIRIDPESPPPLLLSMPNGMKAWAKMVEHVPEYPEAFLSGRWSTIREEEARKYPLLLQLHTAETAAAMQGKTLTEHEKAVFSDLAKLNDSVTTVYSGHLVFGSDRTLAGNLTSNQSGKMSPIEGDWLYELGSKIQTRVRGGLFHSLTFAEEGRLVFFDRGILIVLKKD